MKVLLTATVQSHICQFHKPLVKVLHEHGCEVHVAARDNLAEKNGLKLDFVDKVYDVPFARSPKSLDNLRAYKELKKIIEADKYDIIHCNTPMGGIVTRLAARKARKKGTRVIYTAHGFHFYEGAPKKNWIVFYPIEKLFSRITDTLITITHEDYRLASKKFHCKVAHMHGVGVDETRYTLISFADKANKKVEMGYNAEDRIILCVGELLPNKNQEMIIRAMTEITKKNPNAHLLLAGNGPEKNNLEKLIDSLGLEDRVTLLGYVTNLQDYQHISDGVVSCSKREGLPLNIVEGMLSGTPIVATINRGHKELICNGNTGYLVRVNDVDSIAKYVNKVLAGGNQIKELIANAYEYALDYGFGNVSKELDSIYFG